MSTKQMVQVDGRMLQVSNLDKVLWPKLGLTKADLLDYHVRLHTLTLAHWHGRALTLTRYPHGIAEAFFYQKNVPASAPPWVVSHRREDTDYVVANDLSTLTWLVNSAAIEFHPSTYVVTRPEIPSYAIIDLDPTEPQSFKEAVEVARHCRDVLGELGLRGYPKLSGATGIHIYIPLQERYDFTVSSELVRLIGLKLQHTYPHKVTLERLVRNRRGVYVDYLQNHPGKTIVGVYSPRPTPEATVSAPVEWEDLEYYKPQDFTIRTVPQWIKERGDLFRGVLSDRQPLEALQYLSSISFF